MKPLDGLRGFGMHAGGIGHRIANLATAPHSISPIQAFRRLTHPVPGLADVVADKVVLVTGASSGIGAAAAREIGGAGATVLLVARRETELRLIADEITAAGGDPAVLPCDLSDPTAVDVMIAAALDQHGRVDILVNNAGRSIRRSLGSSVDRVHDFERTMALNYFAAVRLILALLPGMRGRHSGHVVNVSSAGVPARAPRFGAYIASKAALDAACDAFQAETRPDNVLFTTIHMPLVRTPMIAPTSIYDRMPALTPDEAGHVIAQAIVHRPRRLTPAAGRVLSAADWVAPEMADYIRAQAARLGAGPVEDSAP